jgi:predicted DNA-binding transcriptional regulator AlpA
MQKLNQVLREKELRAYDGLGKTQRQVMIDRGEYPAPFRISEGGRAKAWILAEILAWQQRRIESARIIPKNTTAKKD